ncbi:hypothetical protein [Ancylobacter lacus]|uniref:hypothetical protein n=1 Tax=Ancylobacter lacus TaxID=2579970 RepID=UPI001BCAC679|nr:hypothetical protein [Ancylobacter lacus]MBS7539768.1 hypothetical protein [Ancylobacter lacus]
MITITITKSLTTASISGGDGGPGQISDTVGIQYQWSLPLAELTTEPDNSLVLNTLSNVMAVVGGVAQTTSQSIPLAAAGDYDGDSVTLGGTGLGAGLSGGQLQVHGSHIDLYGVNDPDFADLSCLPVGTFFATPVAGITRHNVVLVIEA